MTRETFALDLIKIEVDVCMKKTLLLSLRFFSKNLNAYTLNEFRNIIAYDSFPKLNYKVAVCDNMERNLIAEYDNKHYHKYFRKICVEVK